MSTHLLLALALANDVVPVAVTHRPELTAAIDSHIAANLDSLTGLYRECHANPELSLAEEKTAARGAERLKKSGYAVTTGVGGHGVVGVLENGSGPVVLLRGDMDALPIVEETGLPYASKVTVKGKDGADVGVMHACGHDIHVTCLVGTADLLAKLKDRWSGTVVAILQPAEEVGIGAKAMIDAGLFTRFPKPNAAIALHVSSEPVGTVSLTSGWAFANVDSIDITVHGVGGHGSKPQDAIDPIMIASQIIVSLQTIVSRRQDPLDPCVVTVGSIHSGSKHNIIPNDAKMQITVRTYGDATREKVIASIREIATNTARALGAKRDPDITVRDAEFTPATYNDPALAEAARTLFSAVLGDSNVRESPPLMGGEDFSRYSKELGIPGLMFRLGTVAQERIDAFKAAGQIVPTQHSSLYYPEPEPSISNGVRCFTSLALGILGKR
jgi:amidohydrolase